jgi:hypothetical protein
MMSWFNARVVAVAVSLLVLLQVSRHPGRAFDERYALVACVAFFLAYGMAFLLPLWRSFGVLRILLPLCALIAGWGALALALTADAQPLLADNGITHRTNWPMIAFFAAAVLAFAVFFQNTASGFRVRKELAAPTGGSQLEDDL